MGAFFFQAKENQMTKIAAIFDKILSNPSIEQFPRDLKFVNSLHKHYKEKKRLSPGQRFHLGRLEDKYSNEIKDLSDPILKARIEKVVNVVKKVKGPANVAQFLESIAQRNFEGRMLSWGQQKWFKSLEEKYSEEKIEASKVWEAEYNEEKKSIAKICAQYYAANPPYYNSLSFKVLHKKDFILSMQEWQNMCQNKFALKVIESTLSKPKYSNGSWVAKRKGVNWRKGEKAVPGVVIESNAKPVTSAAKGSKVYLVLFVGKSDPAYIEERYIKAVKNPKTFKEKE